MTYPSITAIVCSYNEAKTIGRVITELSRISFVSHIIVVDDGSQDQTQEVLQSHASKPIVITNKTNLGKGYSVARALESTSDDVILLLDADIINYTYEDMHRLIGPVITYSCDFTVKVPINTYYFALSGVRCYWRKDLLPLTDLLKRSSRHGLELLLNKAMKNKRGRFIQLHDYTHISKFEKHNLAKALWEYYKEAMSLLFQMVK